MVPTITYHPMRASRVPRSWGRNSDRTQADVIRQMSRQKNVITASSVPIWVTAVNEAPRVARAPELGVDRQVGGGRDGQELRQTLDDAENDRFEPAHDSSSRPATVSASRAARMAASCSSTVGAYVDTVSVVTPDAAKAVMRSAIRSIGPISDVWSMNSNGTAAAAAS